MFLSFARVLDLSTFPVPGEPELDLKRVNVDN